MTLTVRSGARQFTKMQLRKRDLKYFNRALSLAHTSTYGVKNIKIGATVVDKCGNTYDGYNSKNPIHFNITITSVALVWKYTMGLATHCMRRWLLLS